MSSRKKTGNVAENEARAVLRRVRISQRKLNLVAAMIRGKPVERALSELAFSPKRIARDVRKTLMSAVANAEENHDLDVDQLIVAEAYTGKALVMKRFRPRARGRAGAVRKPFSHLTIVVRETEEAA